jgi:23S rRNA pseudouridine1911/1915/1917 synthase
MNSKIICPAPTDDDTPASGAESLGLVEESRAFVAGVLEHGQRLDRCLAQWVPELSRSYLAQLVQDRCVQVNDQVVLKPAAKVQAGAQVLIHIQATPAASAFRPENVALDVVFEDEHIVVINKPVGLVVHPGAGNWSGTLLNGLLHRDAQAAHLPRAGIVHRLDKNTSGLMVVARTREAMTHLVEQLSSRSVQRVYLALAQGRMRQGDVFEVDQPIGRDPKNRLRMAVVGSGKPAQTEARVLDAVDGYGLLRCKLKTGRTHQIRVHMAWAGYPLVGDALYGAAVQWGLAGQALHAHDLALIHPETGQVMHWWVPPPASLAQAVSHSGLGYNAGSLL